MRVVGASRGYWVLLMVFLLVGIGPAWAEDSAFETVEERTDQLLAALQESRPYYKEDPARFYRNIEEVLDPVVDFRRIARRVMGKYFRKATQDQFQRFVEVFKTSLLKTYGKGLMEFDNETIRVLPPQGRSRYPDRDTVKMEVISRNGTVYPVDYSLYWNKREGQWMVENVIVNGINLGLTFRTQFEQAMNEHNRNFDTVIENWTSNVDVTE